jgi:peptidoglycan/xylan/chitin deacetylase (PgdA/CDA1 family)
MDDAHRVVRGLAGVLRTHYPNFALGLPLRPDEIPVFIYHDVTADSLAKDLDFLRRNGYETLGLEEFLRRTRVKANRGKAVLLTFDDARLSFHACALPVLRAERARAVLFAPTYWMDAAPSGSVFMTWPQLRECAQSGWVDVQSHGHRHALVFTSGHLAGFADPRSLARYHVYDWPMHRIAGRDHLGHPPCGTPVYRAAPLLSAHRRYLESEDLSRRCMEFVADRGGTDFFARKNWAAELRGLHAQAARGMRGRMQDPDEFERLAASEFAQARAAFERHLGYAPSSLAYPWMLGSHRSLELARDFGIRAAFGVALDYRSERDPRLPVRTFGRLQAEWLHALPGQGRSSIFRIGARKLAGFNKTLHLAH